MYNYKKKEGKLDKIRKIVGYRYRKEKVEKDEKKREFLIQSKNQFWS